MGWEEEHATFYVYIDISNYLLQKYRSWIEAAVTMFEDG